MQAHPHFKAPGSHLLTPRQGEVLALLLQGLSNKRIALALGITESTVNEHVSAILQRLGVRSRVEAITSLQGRYMHVNATAPWRLHGVAPAGVVFGRPGF